MTSTPEDVGNEYDKNAIIITFKSRTRAIKKYPDWLNLKTATPDFLVNSGY